jgi:hypothetical protein
MQNITNQPSPTAIMQTGLLLGFKNSFISKSIPIIKYGK